jgi:nucleoid-associated protein YgaU
MARGHRDKHSERHHDGYDDRHDRRHEDTSSGRGDGAAAQAPRAALRAASGTALAAAAAVALGWWLAVVAAALLAQTRSAVPLAPEQALTLVAALLGLATATWLAVCVLLGTLAHLPGPAGAIGRRAAAAVAPTFTRRVAAILAGAALAGAVAPGTATAGDAGHAAVSAVGAPPAALSPAFAPSEPGHAAPPQPATPAWRAQSQPESAPSPGWVPDRPVVRPQPSPSLLAAAPPADESPGVVVLRGDTLWDIARAHLGPDATDAEVAQEWPRWHDANRSVIGPDASLLLPGQLLHAPSREVTP